MMAEDNIFKFEDDPVYPDLFHEYPASLSESKVPLVIDNGSYKCRVGWATDEKPRLIFKNLTAKQKTKKIQESETLVGNDISNLEVIRYQLKSQFDKNLVTQYDTQEQIFDYVFSHLQINGDGCIPHPVVLTESVCNPNYCREKMSELLFECYHIPSVAYGVDGLFSLYANVPDFVDSLVVSCGYQTIHVLPVLGRSLDVQHCRRLNYGGAQVDSFMHRILQLKYPGHFSALTLTRAEELVMKHCRLAVDFSAELNLWTDDSYYNSHVHKIQLPFNQSAAASVSAEQQKDRQQQQVRRLKELNIKRRQEKLAQEQERLQQLLCVLELVQEDDEDDDDVDDESEAVQRALQEVGLGSVSELQETINKLNLSVQKLQEKMEADAEEKSSFDPQNKQKSARHEPNAKKPKIEKRNSDIGQVPLEGNKEAMNIWLEGLRKQRQDIVNTIAERRQRRSEMTKRRTQASHNRMKILTQLAQNTKKKKEDTFGMNEDDWNVYKEINKDSGDTDSEGEMDKLEEIESYLQEYDPAFKRPDQQETVFDIAEYYRLHIALEQIRIPELLFQPSMLGLEQGGLAETIHAVLNKYSLEDQQRLAQNVFLTGGCSSFRNFSERLSKELQEIRPFQSPFSVRIPDDPILDSWRGARNWSLSPAMSEYSITLADYEEKGGEYLKENSISNRYMPTPR